MQNPSPKNRVHEDSTEGTLYRAEEKVPRYYELATKVTKYEELLEEESPRRKTSMGTYCQEVNSEEIALVDIPSTSSFICSPLRKEGWRD